MGLMARTPVVEKYVEDAGKPGEQGKTGRFAHPVLTLARGYASSSPDNERTASALRRSRKHPN